MTVARLAVQPAPSKAMRTTSSSSTATTNNTHDSIDPKTALQPSFNDKGKDSPTSLSSSQQSQQPSSTPDHHQQEDTPAPLFTPIWDYDRYPIGPCVRENNRSSQEHDNPFQMLEYHQHNHRPQSNARPNPLSATMMRSGSSSSSASASSATSFQQQKKVHGGSSSRGSSRHGSLHINVLGKSMSNVSNGNGISEFLPGATSSAPPSPFLAKADPSSSSSISPDLLLLFQQSLYGGGADDHHHLTDLDQEPITAKSTVSMTAPAAPTSKFDLYKAQMDRVRSSHRLHGRSASTSAFASSTSPTTMVEGGHLPFPSTPSSSVYSPPNTSSPTTIYTRSSPSSPSSSVVASFVASSNNNNPNSKKAHHQHHIFPKLFKKPSLSKSSRVRNLPTAQPPTPTATPAVVSHSRDGSKASLPLSRRGSRSAEPLHNQNLQRSPIEEQQDRWREEWLRPSGAIHSMFRDGPSKFNCPHCGAMKVVSNIQFVPGLMSYLVAFGLMFLTLGTLSYLPFRKDHEGTKDCIHWCPECEQRVARFNRANSTWEWI